MSIVAIIVSVAASIAPAISLRLSLSYFLSLPGLGFGKFGWPNIRTVSSAASHTAVADYLSLSLSLRGCLGFSRFQVMGFSGGQRSKEGWGKEETEIKIWLKGMSGRVRKHLPILFIFFFLYFVVIIIFFLFRLLYFRPN